MKIVRLLAAALAAGALLVPACVQAAPVAHKKTSATSCVVTGAGAPVACVVMPPATVPTVGEQIMDSSGNPGTPWMVTDHNGAPMAWVNIYGFYSAGAPGFPGGLICTTKILQNAACLTPNTGTLELYDSTGHNPVSLTYADIQFLHQLESLNRVTG